MYPILIDFHGIVIPSWHVCFVLAAIAGVYLLLHLNNKTAAIPVRACLDLFLICYTAGYFGARLLSIIIEEPYHGIGVSIEKLFSLGSLTLYGGIILASVLATVYILIKRLRFWEVLDHFVPAVLLGIAIGRIGCFLNGDDYGVPTDSMWGVVFPNLQEEVARYPTQLFEMGFCALLFLCLYIFFLPLRARHGAGIVGLLGVSGYAVGRFLNEYLRGDYRGWVIEEQLSTSQFISMLIVLLVLVGVSMQKKAVKL